MGVNLDKKIGQMFIIRLRGKEITDEFISLIKNYNIGGVILYSGNYDTYAQMLNLINELKKLNSKYGNIPLFIAIDQEWGRVNRFPKDFNNILSARKVSIDEEYVKKAGKLTGYALDHLGINMNLAPVLDIQRFKDSHAIGNRCYGKDKESVYKNAKIIMDSLKEKNVLPVVKHFPGHGLVKVDSHYFLPLISDDIKKSEDIIPFIKAIDDGCDAIMSSHIMVRKMDKIYPTSLSKKIIKNYLIDELGYKGLIITDDLKMKAINILYGYKRSAYRAIEAGNNMIIIGSNYKQVINCINYVKRRMNKEFIENIEKSYQKIVKIKEKYNINDNPNKQVDLKKFNEEIDDLNDKIREKLSRETN